MIFSTQPITSEVQDGDLVVLFCSPENLTHEVIKAGTVHHSRIGKYAHDSIIGKPYGSKISSTEGPKSVFVLRMTPELWTRSLRHRTQILYLPDIAFITQMLDIRPGSKVIECGTGSGSFSHSLARAVSPNGHLFTFEYHEIRAQMARQEFVDHRLSPQLVTIEHRDVCKNGFGMEGVADAVFLDLPAPWEAIPHAKAALNRAKLGRICCFSPCIEQVQKTCTALREHGFFDVEMYECLIKEHAVYKYDNVRKFTLDPVAYATNENGVIIATKRAKTYQSPAEEEAEIRFMSRPNVEIKGHTSYLTFASILDFEEQ